ncbi:hypothetical protein [Bacillus alkalicellulosilyticus]|uniref:hypothetical protein n=1 Tax=Alkalihalobacterium alkalicellulosilyticum TaxID=1912214 RepID=UPI000996E130|nr:hypothetical protein [Bacillus alkalicellulosilyticus]
MFDPTIYENLKVVLEGDIYDLDFAEKIEVTNRRDLIDLATMSRQYSIQYQIRECIHTYPYAEITLRSELEDFAIEKIEGNEYKAGCYVEVEFVTEIFREQDCDYIQKYLLKLWDHRPLINQKIYYTYGHESQVFCKIQLNFTRKINEEQVDDIQKVVHYSLSSLEFFHNKYRKA